MKYHRSRQVLEQNLPELYPGDERILLSMAGAAFLNGKNDEGLQTLGQADLINERLKPHCARLRRRYGLADAEADGKSAINALNVKSAVVIDPDTDHLSYIDGLLQEAGVAMSPCSRTAMKPGPI